MLAARIGDRLQAPSLFTGACNTAVFNAWLARQLGPVLTAQHVVILDNAAFHKSAKTRQLVAARGARLLFLPPYSPDLNPIERDFATLKKRREYHPGQSIGRIVKMYCYLCE